MTETATPDEGEQYTRLKVQFKDFKPPGLVKLKFLYFLLSILNQTLTLPATRVRQTDQTNGRQYTRLKVQFKDFNPSLVKLKFPP